MKTKNTYSLLHLSYMKIFFLVTVVDGQLLLCNLSSKPQYREAKTLSIMICVYYLSFRHR